jgi:hypothetical protein
MAALDFPNSPTNGQVYSDNGKTWTYNSTKTAWLSSGGGGGGSSGVFTADLGSSAAPSITFTGDTNTGMWSPAADTIAFSTNSSERFRISSTGLVGINNDNPSSRLDIIGTGTGIAMRGYGAGNTFQSTFFRYLGTVSSPTIVTAGTTLGRISFSGFDGAGTFAGGAISCDVEAGVGLNDMPGALIFSTNEGNTATTERFRILSTGGITSSDRADAVGYKGIPQNSQTASYTLALSDMGRHISITTGGVVIPANGSVAFPIGSTIVVYNNSASAQNISITTDTLRLAGTATTGTRSLAQRGVATCIKVAATEWVVTGNVT